MAGSLENLKSYLGRSETATDVVTASAIGKLAATLGVDAPASAKGDAIPPGWHGAFFPPLYGPSRMRPDGQAGGVGILPSVPLPVRRLGGVRTSFHEPLRIGDEITRLSELADIRIDEDGSGAMVLLVERNTISNARGLAIVEERDLTYFGEDWAGAKSASSPLVPAGAAWTREIDPDPVMLFRLCAVRFNSHRIHYDRRYTTEVEHLPGLSVPGTLVCQLILEMCRSELPKRNMTYFGYQIFRSIYDTGPFTIAGKPSAGGREAELWAVDPDGNLAMTATAKFA